MLICYKYLKSWHMDKYFLTFW